MLVELKATVYSSCAGLLIMYANSLFFISRIKTIIIYVLDFKLADFLNVFFGKLFDKSLH